MRNDSNLIGFYTLLRKEVVRILRIWPQTLLPPIITVSLYFIIFGGVMGRHIGPISGIAYAQYIVPGLILMSIINNAYDNVVFSFFSNKFQHSIEELFVSPMSNHAILCGYVFGGIIRGFIVGILISILALFFTELSIYSWFLTLLIALLTAFFLALCGMINGIYAKKFDDLSLIPMFVLTPLTYLGGIFYSVDLLPANWQKFMYCNPIFYMVSGFRHAMFGQSEVGIMQSILILVLGIIILYSACLLLLNKGIGIKS